MKITLGKSRLCFLTSAIVLMGASSLAQNRGGGDHRHPGDDRPGHGRPDPVRPQPGDRLQRQLDRLSNVLDRNQDFLSRDQVADISDLIEEATRIALGRHGGGGRACRRALPDGAGRVFAASTACHGGIDYEVFRESNSLAVREVLSGLKTNLGGYITSDPLAVSVGNELLIFARGGDHALYYRTLNSGWVGLGGWLSSITAIYELNGQVVILAVGSDNRTTYRRTLTEGWTQY